MAEYLGTYSFCKEKYKELYFACLGKELIKRLLANSAVSKDGDKDEKKFLKTAF